MTTEEHFQPGSISEMWTLYARNIYKYEGIFTAAVFIVTPNKGELTYPPTVE